MSRLVDRFGKTGLAALASLIWALPMAAWAGSADLSPIDKTAYPWIALGIGLFMLAVWIALVVAISRTSAPPRPHRFEIRQMSSAERRWALAFAAFGAGALAWLNAAATVDWTPLVAAVRAGSAGATVFALALALFLAVMLAGLAWSWRRLTASYRARRASGGPG